MPVPSVSHVNWERTRGLAQFTMGTVEIDATELSFSKQLETILTSGTDWQGRLDEIENDELNSVTHKSLPVGTKVRIRPDEREREHRPEVSEDVAELLVEQVSEQYPFVPVESFGFDRQLSLLLDRVEEYYRELDCYLIKADTEQIADTLEG